MAVSLDQTPDAHASVAPPGVGLSSGKGVPRNLLKLFELIAYGKLAKLRDFVKSPCADAKKPRSSGCD